jgi:hypothetical protein
MNYEVFEVNMERGINVYQIRLNPRQPIAVGDTVLLAEADSYQHYEARVHSVNTQFGYATVVI